MNQKILILAGISFGLLLLTILIIAFASPPQSANPNQPNGIAPTAAPDTSDYQVPDPYATPAPGKAIITGRVCPPPTEIDPLNAPSAMIVAEQIPSRQKYTIFYPGYEQAGTNEYQMQLDPGTYNLYTQTYEGQKLALYSQAMLCSPEQICTDHSLVSLTLGRSQQVREIDICDYDWTLAVPTQSTPVL